MPALTVTANTTSNIITPTTWCNNRHVEHVEWRVDTTAETQWNAHTQWLGPDTSSNLVVDDWLIEAGTQAATYQIRFDTTTTVGNYVHVLEGNYVLEEAPKKVQVLNHRGQPARAQDRDREWSNAAPEELVALSLLRKMVEPAAFRRYLKDHFVNVRGPSGLVYQIARGRSHIKVWEKGDVVAELCVHLKDWYDKPPTDEVVAKMLIAELDEPDIWRRANVYWRTQNLDRPGLHAVGQGGPSKRPGGPGAILRDARGRPANEIRPRVAA
ncbi:hypothetical protein Rctr197k_112 [Virus Rctr197k]|nr:hypothetical protein Rctr197k_112 [Virus Rctr197k]